MKHSIVKLLEAIRLNRRSDNCGPESPSRDEAMMIIKREWAVKDARLAALERVAGAARVVHDKLRKDARGAATSGHKSAMIALTGFSAKLTGPLAVLDKLDAAPAGEVTGE